MGISSNFLHFILLFIVLLFLRVLYLVFLVMTNKREAQRKRQSHESVKTLIVIGSGGHTTEMLRLVCSLNSFRYSPRIYVMASSDIWSEQKINDHEEKWKRRTGHSTYSIVKIPRSRSVHQSYSTSVVTFLYSTLYTVPIMLWHNPDIILCNGPGTCIPVCLVAFFMRCLFLSNNVILFIESICRVKALSLSGKILHFFADKILVQWPDLLSMYSRAQYIGRV
uniref:UDP-N-acetylglucosamine transferase subunit ALG14 n=1 Tax=Clastoptera arizonana TaxID=38151 RepID=A0A1B6DR84_9HEMI